MEQYFDELIKVLDKKFNKNNIIVAYEPIWSIGTGKIPTAQELQKTAAFIKKVLKNLFKKSKKKNILIRPIKVQHGNVQSICYTVDKKLAYISDVSEIFEKDYKYFKNLKYLIIDCLWYKYHPSHFNLDKSLEMIKKFSPRKAILTNLHTDIDYNEIKKKLPKNIIPAYDGLSVNL